MILSADIFVLDLLLIKGLKVKNSGPAKLGSGMVPQFLPRIFVWGTRFRLKYQNLRQFSP